MSTFLFDEIIYGPVRSRRLGLSLGVNLLSKYSKLCSFDCIYCECGFNSKSSTERFPTRAEVYRELKAGLKYISERNETLDSITFSGNGEPTLHPDFPGIIEDTLTLRDKIVPEAVISVLTNSTRLNQPAVVEALKSIDNPYLKLDGGTEETIRLIDKPAGANTEKGGKFSLEDTLGAMEQFEGDFILQTMLLRGSYEGKIIDNTTDEEIDAYLDIVRRLKPRMVTIYTIARDTPAKDLQKIPLAELNEIAEKIRKIIPNVEVSG